MSCHTDNSETIGNTPLVKLRRTIGSPAWTVLAKIESRNPAFSVKCRIGAAMVWDAQARGLLTEGVEILEPTSGNTGIALAFVGASKGIKVTLVMPDSMSVERRKILKAFGARVILTEGSKGMTGAVKKAEEMFAESPGRYFLPQQFRNPANPGVHEQTTGPEIWKDTGGQIDVLVAGVGTGGTITGISRYIKRTRGRQILSVAVEPEASPVISQKLAGLKSKPGRHGIQGIGAGFIPEVLDLSLVDRVETVSDAEAADFTRRLAVEEGILAGISSGAAVAVAARLARLPDLRGGTMVVILPDSGERYLSTALFPCPSDS